ncbi:unnamed protein product [Effrenium voratum]|uniref:Uncharacterized protein n=1 Tax=Effrenium voratum TaxID=2562239 RepID=A0AA36I9N7_9DINO|nr:unnamed protein product [Effrenium voratum]
MSLMDTLLRDETGRDDTLASDRMRHLEHDPAAFQSEQETVAQLIHQVRHEDPSTVFQMLKLLWEYFGEAKPFANQLGPELSQRHDQLAELFTEWKSMSSCKAAVAVVIENLILVCLAIVAVLIKITQVDFVINKEAYQWDLGEVLAVAGFINNLAGLYRDSDARYELCSSLGTLAPKVAGGFHEDFRRISGRLEDFVHESLRLWLLCAVTAAGVSPDLLAERISSFVDEALVCLERHLKEPEAKLRGLQLLVGTLRQMGGQEADLKMICDRAVALSSKMMSKRLQTRAFCLCCELFWLPKWNFQDADRGLLCLRRALQSADGAIHSDPLDVGLFVEILNEVIQLFSQGANQVSPAILSKTLALCVQHVSYIGTRMPEEPMRALRAAVAGLAAKQKESFEAVMVGDVYIPYLEVDLRPAEKLT